MEIAMHRIIPLLIVFLVAASCSKKKTDPVAIGDTTDDTSISDQNISFDPLGSDSGNISGLQTVNFPYDQSILTANARSILNDNMEWIKKNKTHVQIEGHCDERGSIEYNLALGERRARAVRTYMVSLGADPNRLSIISYGEEKPLSLGDSESVYAKNRRANFVPIAR
jgi:peptidoglycan-associated lipoprotein